MLIIIYRIRGLEITNSNFFLRQHVLGAIQIEKKIIVIVYTQISNFSVCLLLLNQVDKRIIYFLKIQRLYCFHDSH